MRVVAVAAVGVVLSLGLLVEKVEAACPADSVRSGTVCMDKYESSVWYVPPTRVNQIARIREGTVTLANLTSAGSVAAGVVQLGLAAGDLNASGCPDTGNGCMDVYAVSIPGVRPAAYITWFQAAAAARNSLKRLPTNQEWQVAALGTPDTGGADNGLTTCNTDSVGPHVTTDTGSRSDCVSDVGAFDMVGNLWEWVGDWGDIAANCVNWDTTFGNDRSCLGGLGQGYGLPGALVRGGSRASPGTLTGVFMVTSSYPNYGILTFGFRCAR